MESLPPDIARLIYHYLSDEDLTHACMLNKNFSDKVCNDNFWIWKIMSKFGIPVDMINKYKENNTYWGSH